MPKLRGLILTFILSFFTIIGIAQNSENYAAALLDSNEMLIGDHMTVHFKMELGDKDRVMSVTPVEPFDSAQSFEIVKKGEWKTSARQGRTVYFRDIVFTVWDTGLYKIPLVEFMVQYPNGEQRFFKTNPLLLTVKNPKDWDKALELAPIKDIIKEDWTFEDVLPYAMLVGAIILLSLVGWFLYQRLKKQPEKQAIQRTIIQPPHIVAIEKLTILKNKNLWQSGEVKEYYSELSHILREYLERQMNIPALESTTDELIAILNKGKISDNLLENVQDLLRTADLVKFAKVTPPDNVHDKFWYDAVEIVDKMKPRQNEVVEISRNEF